MFKVTCLADPERKVGTPRRLGLRNPQRMALVQCVPNVKFTHNQSICNKLVF
jgi:hypothetical protein